MHNGSLSGDVPDGNQQRSVMTICRWPVGVIHQADRLSQYLYQWPIGIGSLSGLWSDFEWLIGHRDRFTPDHNSFHSFCFERGSIDMH